MPIAATGNLAKTIVVDTVMITNFSINLYPMEARALVINYATGYIDNEVFVPHEYHSMALVGDEFYAIASATPDTSLGLYEALKDILYVEVAKHAGL